MLTSEQTFANSPFTLLVPNWSWCQIGRNRVHPPENELQGGGKAKSGGREAQRRFFSEVSSSRLEICCRKFHLKFKAHVNCANKNKKYVIESLYLWNHVVNFEVTAEEMEQLYDKFKEDFLLFGYTLDFYKS